MEQKLCFGPKNRFDIFLFHNFKIIFQLSSQNCSDQAIIQLLTRYSLFWNIWSNPRTKIFEVVKYLLMMSDNSSLTWSAHIRIVFQMYQLPDPLQLLHSTPCSKNRWKSHTSTAVLSHHEKFWRQKSSKNYKLQYLNVQCTGLSGKLHPVLSWVLTTQDVMVVRPHLKMLAGDYVCFDFLSHDRGIDPYCRLCQEVSDDLAPPAEDYCHILTGCRATAQTRLDKLPTLLNIVMHHSPNNSILDRPSNKLLTQFILDCSSLNLPSDTRIPHDHPGFIDIVRQCSIMINAIHKDRTRQLRALGQLG